MILFKKIPSTEFAGVNQMTDVKSPKHIGIKNTSSEKKKKKGFKKDTGSQFSNVPSFPFSIKLYY